MNAGGTETTAGSVLFAADQDASADAAGFNGGDFYTNSVAIAGTDDDELYQSVRYGSFSFEAPVTNGNYTVRLHYAELYAPFTVNDRVFQVILEGELVELSLDVIAEVGSANALVRQYVAQVEDGRLEIEFLPLENHAMVSAIEIVPQAPNALPLSLSLTPEPGSAPVGARREVRAIVTYDDGSQWDVTDEALWFSANPSSVYFTANPGQLEALATPGTNVLAYWGGMVGVTHLAVTAASTEGHALVYVRANRLNLFDTLPRHDWWIEEGSHADIMHLEPISANGVVTNLTNLPSGIGAVAFTPSVSPDGDWVLFSMRREDYQEHYQLYKVRRDGTQLTQLTFPPAIGTAYDSINPVIVGQGKIAFLSNRDFMYDEYGKRNQFNLYVMNADGSNVTRYLDGLSGNYDLSCFDDGRLVFSRWDYRPLMNKVAIDNYSLWCMNTDGSGLKPLWGLYHLTPRPGNRGIQDWRRAHQFPDGRLVTIGAGRTYTQHNYGAGFIAMTEPNATLNAPYTNITPEIPENTDPVNNGRYLEAVPWGNDKLVTSFSEGPVTNGQSPEPNFDLYALDATGQNRTALVTDAGYHLGYPRVVRVKSPPPLVTSSLNPALQWGVLAADNVYVMNLEQEIGSLKIVPHDADNEQTRPVKVRLMEGHILKKTQFYDPQPADTTFISDVKASLAYSMLAEVPVHADGSFAARVPAHRPILIQTINNSGQVIQAMPFWAMVGKGEVKRCVGCHDPLDDLAVDLAESNEALDTTPIPDATVGDIFDFQDDLAPTLQAKCASCHSGSSPAANIDLSADRTLYRSMAYRSLARMEYGKYGIPSYARFSYLASHDRGLGGVDSFLLNLVGGTLPVGATAEMNERLSELHPTHANLLNDQEKLTLGRWTSMATLFGTPFYRYIPEGESDNHTYPQPDNDLWQSEVAPMLTAECSSCHTQYPSALPVPGFTVNVDHLDRSASVNGETATALLNRTGVNSNFDNPTASPILRLALGNQGHPQIFSSTSDPDYQLLLQWIESGF